MACATTANSGDTMADRFTKARIVRDLRERAETMRFVNGFTDRTGTAQLPRGGRSEGEKQQNLERAINYGKWQELKNLIEMIETGRLGVSELG